MSRMAVDFHTDLVAQAALAVLEAVDQMLLDPGERLQRLNR